MAALKVELDEACSAPSEFDVIYRQLRKSREHMGFGYKVRVFPLGRRGRNSLSGTPWLILSAPK
jgi:hypothetical protein